MSLTLSPLAQLVDDLANTVTALDIWCDVEIEHCTPDEIAEFGTAVALLKDCAEALRDAVTAREARLTRLGTT